ncbi:MAG: IS3 family transposase, partial [bacterium]|nr:IS3 family transposase [bacterium]
LVQIASIKSEHPLWGYRRVWAYLRYRDGIVVGKNRIYRIMKENRLIITKQSRLLAKRVPIKPKPRADTTQSDLGNGYDQSENWVIWMGLYPCGVGLVYQGNYWPFSGISVQNRPLVSRA